MSRMGRSRSYHGKCGGERRNPTRYGEEMWTSPSKHSWRKRKTSEYRDSRWREDTRNIEQWRKETVLSAERRIQELREGQRILKKDDQISQSSESSRNSFPRSTETSVKESTRSQRYEGRNYKDLREIITRCVLACLVEVLTTRLSRIILCLVVMVLHLLLARWMRWELCLSFTSTILGGGGQTS